MTTNDINNFVYYLGMVFAHQRTRLKNRIHSVIDKYGLQHKFSDISDMFGKEGSKLLQECLGLLPEQTRYALETLLHHLDEVEHQIGKKGETDEGSISPQ